MPVMRLLRGVLILSAVAFLLPALAPGEARGDQTGGETPLESARAVLSDDSYQSQLPVKPPPRLHTSSEPARKSSPPPSDSERPAVEARRAERDDSGAAANSDTTWLYIVAALLAALLLGYILLMLYRRRRAAPAPGASKRRQRKSEKPAPAPAQAPVRIDEPTIFDEADRLAEAGLYGEAIHLLLLSGLEHVGRRTRQRIPPHLTNRELLRALRLAENMTDALSILVRRSERSHFGGAALGAADYQLSREKFQLFALESGGAAP